MLQDVIVRAIVGYSSAGMVKTVIWMMLVCVVSYVKHCKSAIANISLSFHLTLFGILMLATYLWEFDLAVETYTLELTFITVFLVPHILVALWVGYALNNYLKIKSRCQLRSSHGCRVTLEKTVSVQKVRIVPGVARPMKQS